MRPANSSLRIVAQLPAPSTCQNSRCRHGVGQRDHPFRDQMRWNGGNSDAQVIARRRATDEAPPPARRLRQHHAHAPPHRQRPTRLAGSRNA